LWRFFVFSFFLIKGLANYLPGRALNHNPLISASWVARITGVSHQHLARFLTLLELYVLVHANSCSKCECHSRGEFAHQWIFPACSNTEHPLARDPAPWLLLWEKQSSPPLPRKKVIIRKLP
jgi:hypothetical protein